MSENIVIDSLTLSDLLDCAANGDAKELVRQIELATRSTHLTSTPGKKLTETEKLLDEALWYARDGDLSEATYRLQQAENSYEGENEFDEEDEYA